MGFKIMTQSRLEEITSRLMKENKERIQPLRRRLLLDLPQGELFDTSRENQKKPVRKAPTMGRFYEELTSTFFGGTRNWETDRSNDKIITRPDIIDNSKKRAMESKAVRVDQQLNLTDRQMRGYIAFQFTNPEYEIYFAIYRHSVQRINMGKWKGKSVEEVHKTLTEKTRYFLLLPFSLIMTLYHLDPTEELTSRFEWTGEEEGRPFEDCTTVFSRALHGLLTDPEEIIKIVGMDPSKYKIERKVSPGNFKVNGTLLQKFPIALIGYKNHKEWSKEFIETYIQKYYWERHGEGNGDSKDLPF
jgi:hypothetical protein